MNALKGDIQITDNIGFVREILYSDTPNIKVISMDEDGAIPLEHPDVIGGTCLLPPMDALIAEADGDEVAFNEIYMNHFYDPFVDQFISALISYLFVGGNLLIYHPNVSIFSCAKFREIIWILYGINIGIVGQQNCSYDQKCVPVWLCMIYMINAILPIDFLRLYPVESLIPNNIMDKLLVDMAVFEDGYENKVRRILHIRDILKTNPNIKIPLFKVIE